MVFSAVRFLEELTTTSTVFTGGSQILRQPQNATKDQPTISLASGPNITEIISQYMALILLRLFRSIWP